MMASLNMFLAPATAISSSTTTSITTTTTPTTSIATTTTRARRVRTFATTKGKSGESKEEKGFLEWLAGALEKDGFVETDPLLQKVEGKSSAAATTTTRTISGKKTAVPPPKKSGGDNGGFSLGGLFSKK